MQTCKQRWHPSITILWDDLLFEKRMVGDGDCFRCTRMLSCDSCDTGSFSERALDTVTARSMYIHRFPRIPFHRGFIVRICNLVVNILVDSVVVLLPAVLVVGITVVEKFGPLQNTKACLPDENIQQRSTRAGNSYFNSELGNRNRKGIPTLLRYKKIPHVVYIPYHCCKY